MHEFQEQNLPLTAYCHLALLCCFYLCVHMRLLQSCDVANVQQTVLIRNGPKPCHAWEKMGGGVLIRAGTLITSNMVY